MPRGLGGRRARAAGRSGSGGWGSVQAAAPSPQPVGDPVWGGDKFAAVATTGSATLRGINVDNCGPRVLTGQANSSRLVRPIKF